MRRAIPIFLLLAISGCQTCAKPGAKNTWTKTALAGADIVTTIAADPRTPKVVYAGTTAASTDKGFFRSKDGGASWKKLAGGLPDRAAGWIAVSPRDGSVLVNPGVEGIWRSADGGETFARAAADPGNCGGFFFHPTTSTVWVMTSQQGAYRSTDNGKSWARTANTGLPLNKFGLGPVAHDGQKLYLGTSGQGVYTSADEGNSWTKAASAGIPDGTDIVAMLAPHPATLFVQTAAAGLFRSSDGAATFAKVEAATRHAVLAIDPSNPQRFFVGANDRAAPPGLLESKDGAKTWANIGPAVSVEALTIGADGALYVGTTGDGVHRLGGS